MEQREILFKAQRTDGKGWVEGDLLTSSGKPQYILPTWSDDYDEYEQIIPETVCQFSGEEDRNESKIFEGDELNYCIFDHNDHDTQFKGVVNWVGTEFIVTQIPDKFSNGKYGINLGHVVSQDDELEITGNIHDKAKT